MVVLEMSELSYISIPKMIVKFSEVSASEGCVQAV